MTNYATARTTFRAEDNLRIMWAPTRDCPCGGRRLRTADSPERDNLRCVCMNCGAVTPWEEIAMKDSDVKKLEEAVRTAEKLGLFKKLWRAIKKALVRR